MDIYVSYTCLKITSVFHITLSHKARGVGAMSEEKCARGGATPLVYKSGLMISGSILYHVRGKQIS